MQLGEFLGRGNLVPRSECRLLILHPKTAAGASRVFGSIVWPADKEQAFLPPEAAAGGYGFCPYFP